MSMPVRSSPTPSPSESAWILNVGSAGLYIVGQLSAPLLTPSASKSSESHLSPIPSPSASAWSGLYVAARGGLGTPPGSPAEWFGQLSLTSIKPSPSISTVAEQYKLS